MIFFSDSAIVTGMKKVIFLLFFLIISISCLSASKDGFNEWKKTFEKQAVNQNISQNTLNKYFAQSSYLEAVIQADRKQPEFTLTFTKYMKKAVTQDRIIQARQLWTEKKLLLQKIQDKSSKTKK